MKSYIVAVVVWIETPAKHWWGESKTSTGVTQHIRKAESEEVAEALATAYALEDWRKRLPESTVSLKHLTSWDITDRLKDP